MAYRVCIVSAYRPDVFDEARHALSLGQNIEVIVDRRIGERRSAPRENSRDRRCRSIEDELRTEGYAIVEVEVPTKGRDLAAPALADDTNGGG
jgi:hypothetical protein